MPKPNRLIRLVPALLSAGLLLAPGPASADTTPVTATLTIYVNGIGTVKGPGIDCGEKGKDCTETYPLGTSVTLTAMASTKSLVSGWAGGCGGTGDTCTVVMDTGSKVVTAVFGFVETIAVSAQGSGSGTIQSDPAGIDCGSTCAWSYTGDTPVILSAVPKPGSVFVGWSGNGCKGNGYCTLHVTYGSLMVYARFEKKGGGGSSGGGSSGGGSYSPPATTFATALGGAAQMTSLGRLLVVRFKCSRPAAVTLHTYYGSHPFSTASVNVTKGPTTIRLPMPSNAPGGTYTVSARLDDGAGHVVTLRWSLALPG